LLSRALSNRDNAFGRSLGSNGRSFRRYLHCVGRPFHITRLFVGRLYGLTQSLSLPAKDEELERKDNRLGNPDIDKRLIFHDGSFGLPEQPITISEKGNTSFCVFPTLSIIVYKPCHAKIHHSG
jgi:hypothetical protein